MRDGIQPQQNLHICNALYSSRSPLNEGRDTTPAKTSGGRGGPPWSRTLNEGRDTTPAKTVGNRRPSNHRETLNEGRDTTPAKTYHRMTERNGW